MTDGGPPPQLSLVAAQLVGATGGVGYQLLQQQQLFDMAGAPAWTLQPVYFALIVQGALTLIETTAFRYRAVSGRGISALDESTAGRLRAEFVRLVKENGKTLFSSPIRSARRWGSATASWC